MHEVIAEGEPDILETAQAQQEPDEKDYTQVTWPDCGLKTLNDKP